MAAARQELGAPRCASLRFAGAPPASRPLFDEKIHRFSGWHHHFIWQVVLSFLEFKEKRPSPF